MSLKQYNNVKLPRLPRNNLNLSHTRLLSADPFYLYPTFVEDCIPGDYWKINNEVLVRNNPLASPIMHEQNLYIHYFFVPYRILWKDWQKFFTGGVDGTYTSNIPNVDDCFSNFAPDFMQAQGIFEYIYNEAVDNLNDLIKIPNAFPLLAYYKICIDYYRDQNIHRNLWGLDLSNEGEIYEHFDMTGTGKGFFKRCWEKDYFTSMLPWQQRGIVPAFNLFGTGNLTPKIGASAFSGTQTFNSLAFNTINGTDTITHAGINQTQANNSAIGLRDLWNNAIVQIDGAGLNADVHDMRFAFQVTKYLERSARTGSRYVEQLKAHFQSSPNDDRLQRPEYIGGTKLPIVVNEVLQTAEAGTTGESGVGSMYGHGISADRTHIANYYVKEHGCILGLLSVMPKTMYMQGTERMWLKESKFDFYFPEFMNLSEQAVYTEELYNRIPVPADRVIGYQARYDEYRFRRNTVHGLFKSDFAYWHMARKFNSTPTLNSDLIQPSENEIHDVVNGVKRVLQVPSEPMYLIHVGNICSAIRSMPWMAEPGRIDHN